MRVTAQYGFQAVVRSAEFGVVLARGVDVLPHGHDDSVGAAQAVHVPL